MAEVGAWQARPLEQMYPVVFFDALTPGEQTLFAFAGQFMIYMQALRFLTDHLNDDVYYGAAYPGQNRDRAANQLTLLERYTEARAI